MITRIKHLVILGGGTSAWLSAAYLRKNFPDLKISVVDKEVSTPVGVGEGTLLNFKTFMENCGFSVDDWFSKIDATYKAGILFPNWKKKGLTVWHPFKMNRVMYENINLFDLWSSCQELNFANYGTTMYDITINQNKIDLTENYGYHVDCLKLVQYIKEKLGNSINLINSEMVEVIRGEDQHIVELVLKNNQRIKGDLFFDCTGFKSLLNQSPSRVDLKNRLFCDTAIAGHIPYDDRKKELRPYVISEAVECGWVWNIPTRKRIGSGLVFNRSITDVEEAKDIFVNHWQNRISKESLKVIDWTPFYNENFWHENVISIGLSAGFIEPLESTGIALIMEGVYQAAQRIRGYKFEDLDLKVYNNIMKCFFEESIDFVSMHYSVTEREEPFWKFVKENSKISQRQQFYIDQLNDPSQAVPHQGTNTNFFCGENWSLWLIQLGWPVAPRNVLVPTEQAKEILISYHDRNEKFRHVWSRNHVDEIERLENFYGI